MTDSNKPIHFLMEAYRDAVFARDVEAFMALYDAEARVFDLWGAWSYDGAAAWRKMVSEWLGSLGTERVVVGFEDVTLAMSGDLAVVHAFVTYQGVSAEGQKLRAMSNRLTWALKRSGASEGVDAPWKIVHEHTSAPVAPDTMKVMLER